MYTWNRKNVLGCLALAAAAASVGWSTVCGQDNEAEQHRRSVNNLKQLALGMHRYHDKHKEFPTATYDDKDGKPLLSWRLALLPYLGHQDLYEQFKLEEPWDSAHNKKLLARIPDVFAPVRNAPKEKGMTYYQVFTGKGAAFDGKQGLGIAQFFDGTSNTILIIEAKDAVPWTKPADLPFDVKKPLPKLGGLFKDGFHAALADGSVRYIDRSITENTLRSAITRNGGEVLGPDW
jgi:hypothetical protein